MTKARMLFPSFLSIAIAAVLSCSERRSSTREVEKSSAVSLVPGDSKSEVSYAGSLMIESIGDELADAGYSAALVEKIVTTAHAEVSLAATLAFGPLDEISLNLQSTDSSENLTVGIAAEAVARGSITALRSGSETSLNEDTSSDVVFFALSRGVKYLNDLTGYPVLHDSKLTLAANIATVDTVGLIAKAQIKGISTIKSEGKINGLSTDAIASTAQRMTSSLFSASSQIGLANDATVGELAGNVMKSIINAVASSELKTDAAGIITKIPNSLEGFKTLRLEADVLSATSKTIVEECVTGINVAQLQTDAKDLVAKIVTASVTGVYVAAANTESMASAASTAAKTAFVSYNTLKGSTDVTVQTEAARTMFSSAISAFDTLPGWNLEVISAVTSSMRSKAVEATQEIGLTGDNGASIVASVSVGIFDSIATMPTIEKLGTDSTAIQTKITELSNAAIADIQSKFPDAKADYRNAINDAAKKVTTTQNNAAPTDLTLSNQILAENSGSNAVVGNLSATDPDASNTFTYSLVAGTGSTDNGSFNILGSQLRMTASADFETKSSYSIRVRATDQGGLFFEKQLAISISNVNEAPTLAVIADQTTLEDKALPVALSPFDTDRNLSCSSTNFLYSSSDPSVVAASGAVSWSGTWPNCSAVITPVFNSSGSSSVTITVTDGSFTASQIFNLTVTAVNDPPVISDVPGQTTNQDTTLSGVSVSISDIDSTLTCNSIAASSSNTAMIPTTNVTLSGSVPNCLISLSPAARQTGASTITLTLSDGTSSAQDTFVLTVSPVNSAPTDLSLSSLSIAENSGANALVGTLSATDPDTGDTFTYILASGAGSTDNGSFNISGNQLRMNSSAGFETKSSYSILVRATDQGGLFIEKQLTITITNINEAPTDLALSSLSLAENAGSNAVVGNLSATDPDAANTFTYSLVTGTGTGSTDNGSFNILGSQLRMTASADFETKSSYSIRVRAKDQGELFIEKQLTITVTNTNEAPTDLALSSLSLAENAGSNAVVGNLSATDPDAANTFTYSLVTGTGSTDNGSFNILGSQLRMTASADFETKSSYSIRVKATDQGELFIEKQLTITITNINEAPSLSAISNQTTNQDTPTAAISLTVTDADGPPRTCNATSLSYTSQTTSVVASTGAINWAGTWPNCTAVITPVTGATGSSLLSISVSDGQLASVPQSFILQVGSKSVGWAQEAYLKASNANASDYFGYSVAISGDTAVIGAQNESSNQTTITNGITSSADNSAQGVGASYIYKRTGTNWAQEAYLKASNAEAYDNFGKSVAISGDTAVIGALFEASNQTTITNAATSSADNTAADSGASYIYKRTGTNWAQEAYIKASNANASDNFGNSVAISGDTAVIGASGEASNQTTITNGTTSSADNSAQGVGASYIYKRTGTNWAQEAYLKASNANASDYFGFSVAISGDTAVIGANWEFSIQTTITNGTTSSADNNAAYSGASYIYKRTGTNWAQEAYLKASNANAYDYFGYSVAISGDTAVIGARGEASNQTTITNGTTSSADNSAGDAGASYIYKRTGTTWAQEAYLKASNANSMDWFGYSVAISGDTAVIGAPYEASNQTTITNGTTASANDTAAQAGASYIYKRTGTNWAQEAYIKASNASVSDNFGYSVAISGDTAVIGAWYEDSNQTTITNGITSSADNSAGGAGAVYVYRSLSRLFDPDLRVSAKTTTSITLSWGSNLGSASQVKIAPAVSGTGTPLPCTDISAITLAAGATTYTYSGLTTGTKYGFRVCGFDGTNVSEGSVIWENTN